VDLCLYQSRIAIDIRNGANKFSAEAFRTADGSLVIERFFNWRLGFQYELHFNTDAGSYAETISAAGSTG
jgi:hypothetical protein